MNLEVVKLLEEEEYRKILKDFWKLLGEQIRSEDAKALKTSLAEIEVFHQQKYELFKLLKGVSRRKEIYLLDKIQEVNRNIYAKARLFGQKLSQICAENKASVFLPQIRELLKDILNEEVIIKIEQKKMAEEAKKAA